MEDYARNDYTYFGRTHFVGERIIRKVLNSSPIYIRRSSLAKYRRLYRIRGGHIPVNCFLDVLDYDFNQNLNVSDYNIFSVVRDPWDMMCSLYFYAKRKFKGTKFPSFDEFVEHRCLRSDIEDQFQFLSDNSGNLFVKNIMHFESLADDWRKFSSKISGLTEILPKHNV